MPDYHTVARMGEIPENEGRTFLVEGHPVAVFHHGGQYWALDDACPHMGASLGTGDVGRGMVICDRHLWPFRLEDGVCPDSPHLKATTHEVRVEGDEVQVRLNL